MAGLRIVFMGTPEFACPTLMRLIERGEEILAVVTQPDRPKGRGRQVLPSAVKLLATRNGIAVFQPLKVRDPAFIDTMRELDPDLVVVVAFGQILPQSLLDIPLHGCINVHASLLPAYRGAAPINWCIINGETESGVTTILMNAGLDTGDMLLKKRTLIDPDEDSRSLHDRLSVLGAEAMVETLDLLCTGRLVPEKQVDSMSSYAPMLKKEDGLIDWDQPAQTIKNMVRGMTPWPGAFSRLEGMTLKIFRVEVAGGGGIPGSVLRADLTGLEVSCGVGSLLVLDLQLEGKKRLTAREFLTGYKIAPGTILGERKTLCA